jgi:hypothetical protein
MEDQMGKRQWPAWSGGWKRLKDVARGLLATALPEGTWTDRRKFIMSVAKGIGGLWLGSKVLDRYQPATVVPNPGCVAVTPLAGTISATGRASGTSLAMATSEPGSHWYTAARIAATRPQIAPIITPST